MKYIVLQLGICVVALPGTLLWMSRSNPQQLPAFSAPLITRVVEVKPVKPPGPPAEAAPVAKTIPGPALAKPLYAEEPAVLDEPSIEIRPEPAPVVSKPEIRAAANPLSKAGTCGEFRDGKLTVVPCAEIRENPGEWLTKGSQIADAH